MIIRTITKATNRELRHRIELALPGGQVRGQDLTRQAARHLQANPQEIKSISLVANMLLVTRILLLMMRGMLTWSRTELAGGQPRFLSFMKLHPLCDL